ncbi:MAG: hypothetical protein E6G34_06695 [Actinobacteria bacterium]|nr:MAG: hypothetical protein E6G34_06695 [Actinomycetota bacterium]
MIPHAKEWQFEIKNGCVSSCPQESLPGPVLNWTPPPPPGEGVFKYRVRELKPTVSEYSNEVTLRYPLATEELQLAGVELQGDAASWFDPYGEFENGVTNRGWIESHWTGHARDFSPFYHQPRWEYPTKLPGVEWTPSRDYWTGEGKSESGEFRFKIGAPEPQGKEERLRFLKGPKADINKWSSTGLWADDVQFSGDHRPPEPELKEWNKAQAELFEEWRTKFPTAFLATNSHAFDLLNACKCQAPVLTAGGKSLKTMIKTCEPAGEPYYEDLLKVLEGSAGGRPRGAIYEEFGASKTSRLRFGSAAYLKEWFEYVDYLHKCRNIAVEMGWDFTPEGGTSLEPLEYSLAVLMMVTNGTDEVESGHQHPAQGTETEVFFPMYKWQIGTAKEGRHLSEGVWSRQFTKGAVYLVQPGGGTKTITLPRRMENTKRELVTSFSLKENHAAILKG